MKGCCRDHTIVIVSNILWTLLVGYTQSLCQFSGGTGVMPRGRVASRTCREFSDY
jgi:hypothetical protein